MRYCQKCNAEIKNWTIINGEKKNIQRRKFCLKCSPYNSHNTRNLCKEKAKKSKPLNVKVWRKRFKERIVFSMGGKCQCCGYNKCIEALELHHINPEEKEMGFGGMRGHPRAWEVVVKELRKCVLVCSNCHREIHAKIKEIPNNVKKFNEDWVDYKAAQKNIVM